MGRWPPSLIAVADNTEGCDLNDLNRVRGTHAKEVTCRMMLR